MVMLTHSACDLQPVLNILHEFHLAKGYGGQRGKNRDCCFRKASPDRRGTGKVPGEWLYAGATVQRVTEARYPAIFLHKTKGLSCAIESLTTAARKATWALCPRFKLAGISDSIALSKA